MERKAVKKNVFLLLKFFVVLCICLICSSPVKAAKSEYITMMAGTERYLVIKDSVYMAYAEQYNYSTKWLLWDDYYDWWSGSIVDGNMEKIGTETLACCIRANKPGTYKVQSVPNYDFSPEFKDKLTTTWYITVTPVQVTEIERLSKDEVTMEAGESEKVFAHLYPKGCYTDQISCISSDTNVAECFFAPLSEAESDVWYRGGYITINGKKAGTANITIRTYTGDYATVKVTVKGPLEIEKVTLNKSKLSIYKGKSSTLKAAIAPEGAQGTITWSSSDKSIATVNSNGKVTGKKAGKVTITAKASSGVKAKCTVTVKNLPKIQSVTLNKTKLTLEVGKTYTLQKTISPSNAQGSISWSSSNKSVATVNSSGKITAKKAGKATITAKASSGVTAKCTVTVKRSATGAKLSASSVTLKKGKTKTLTCTLTPSNSIGKVTWKSSNEKVATVNSSGKVTAKKVGTATITATMKSKTTTKSVKCKVTVKGMTISNSAITLAVGEKKTLSCKLYATGSEKVTWSSQDKSVAKVSSKGKVTAVGAGTTYIVAKSGSYSVKCKVTVKSNIYEQNISKLKDYIKENGEIKSNGNMYIWRRFEDYCGGDILVNIDYDVATNGVVFSMLFTFNFEDSAAELYAEMWLNGAEGTSVDYPQVELTEVSSRTGIRMETEIIRNKYDGKLQDFELCANNTGESMLEEFVDYLGTITLNEAFDSWGILLTHELGMTMKDLGYTSYNYDATYSFSIFG